MKYLRIYNISIHINFYQNRFINESVRKNFLKFSERQTERRKDGVFFVSCRRTYVLNNQTEFSTKVVKLRFKPLISITKRCKRNPHLFLTPSFPVTLFQKSEVEAALQLFLYHQLAVRLSKKDHLLKG